MTDLDFIPACGNCRHYKPIKDKHGEEGVCFCMPPSVVAIQGMNIARQPTLQFTTAPRPCVKETDCCGQWFASDWVLPSETKTLED